jgi:hypothetical protein
MKVERAREMLNVAEMSASAEILKSFAVASLGLCGQKLRNAFTEGRLICRSYWKSNTNGKTNICDCTKYMKHGKAFPFYNDN